MKQSQYNQVPSLLYVGICSKLLFIHLRPKGSKGKQLTSLLVKSKRGWFLTSQPWRNNQSQVR